MRMMKPHFTAALLGIVAFCLLGAAAGCTNPVPATKLDSERASASGASAPSKSTPPGAVTTITSAPHLPEAPGLCELSLLSPLDGAEAERETELNDEGPRTGQTGLGANHGRPLPRWLSANSTLHIRCEGQDVVTQGRPQIAVDGVDVTLAHRFSVPLAAASGPEQGLRLRGPDTLVYDAPLLTHLLTDLSLATPTPMRYPVPQIWVRSDAGAAALLETTVAVDSLALRDDVNALRDIARRETPTAESRGILVHAVEIVQGEFEFIPRPRGPRFVTLLNGQHLRDVALFATARLVRTKRTKCGPYKVKAEKITPTFGKTFTLHSPEFITTERSDYVVEVRARGSDKVLRAQTLEGGPTPCPSLAPNRRETLVGPPPEDASLIKLASRLARGLENALPLGTARRVPD